MLAYFQTQVHNKEIIWRDKLHQYDEATVATLIFMVS